MKKLIFTVMVLGTVLSSCNNNGGKVETANAKKVEISKNEATVIYNKFNSESHIEWRASHLGGVQHRYGKISLKSAEFLVNNNKLTNLIAEIDMSSFTVENFKDKESKDKLTHHLQSDDFFKISSFPTSKFELTNVENLKGEYNSLVTGNLTILDVTKSITFKANVLITENKISLKSEDFAVNRTDWGLTYHTEGTEGVPTDYLISNDIGFTIDVSLTN